MTYDDWKLDNPYDEYERNAPPRCPECDRESCICEDERCEHSQPPCDGCAEADRLRGGTEPRACSRCLQPIRADLDHRCARG